LQQSHILLSTIPQCLFAPKMMIVIIKISLPSFRHHHHYHHHALQNMTNTLEAMSHVTSPLSFPLLLVTQLLGDVAMTIMSWP